MALNIEAFAKGLIAALVSADVDSIQPKAPEHRRALRKVHKLLQDEVTSLKSGGHDRDWLKQVVRVRNSLEPGPTGAFDQFETALRDLQLTFTECPNPYYEDIDFTVTKPFASSTLAAMPPREQDLVTRAAKIFVESTSSR